MSRVDPTYMVPREHVNPVEPRFTPFMSAHVKQASVVTFLCRHMYLHFSNGGANVH